jgi:hypothetical protein
LILSASAAAALGTIATQAFPVEKPRAIWMPLF